MNQELKELLMALLKIMEENIHTYMPGFTHLQKAQRGPWLIMVAQIEMFRRDRGAMADIRKRMNTCPLEWARWQGDDYSSGQYHGRASGI